MHCKCHTSSESLTAGARDSELVRDGSRREKLASGLGGGARCLAETELQYRDSGSGVPVKLSASDSEAGCSSWSSVPRPRPGAEWGRPIRESDCQRHGGLPGLFTGSGPSGCLRLRLALDRPSWSLGLGVESLSPSQRQSWTGTRPCQHLPSDVMPRRHVPLSDHIRASESVMVSEAYYL
jgi:hypothetical protein